jgi:hypothetical protein
MKGSCAIPLIPGWSLNINVGDKESVLIVLGPQGQGAAWTCEAGLPRHFVLDAMLEAACSSLQNKGNDSG